MMYKIPLSNHTLSYFRLTCYHQSCLKVHVLVTAILPDTDHSKHSSLRILLVSNLTRTDFGYLVRHLQNSSIHTIMQYRTKKNTDSIIRKFQCLLWYGAPDCNCRQLHVCVIVLCFWPNWASSVQCSTTCRWTSHLTKASRGFKISQES